MSIGHDTVVAVTDTNYVVCELELRKSQKDDSNGIIQCLRIKPTSKSRFSIPLCRLRVLPLVRRISEIEVQRLECEFVMRYREGDRIMYVFNDIPVDLPVSPAIMASWSPLWQEASLEFDVKLKEDPDLAHLCGQIFFVWEGNHRLTAWWRHINNNHADQKSWHVSVDCIMVDPRECTGVFLNAMSDINW
jgi:hypothetical protein